LVARSTSFDWTIENNEAFGQALNRLGKATSDFRIPFRLIASDFYRSNRKLFTLQSRGLYQDLAPAIGIEGNPTTTSNYKQQKKKKVGFVYPILVGKTRVLSNSILGKNNSYSIFSLGRQSLEMGSSVPYGKYHQSDAPRAKIPQRKFVFIDGGPADKSNDSNIAGRRERWTAIIDTHVRQLTTGSIF
jgi:hypothetical protein